MLGAFSSLGALKRAALAPVGELPLSFTQRMSARIIGSRHTSPGEGRKGEGKHTEKEGVLGGGE